MNRPSNQRLFRKTSGLTLLEMMVALGLVVVLAALLLGGISRITETSRSSVCLANLRTLHSALTLYANDHNDCYPPGWAAIETGSNRTWLWRLSSYLHDDGSRKVGVMYCPSTKVGGNGIYRRDYTQWHTDYDANGNILKADLIKNKRSLYSPSLIVLFDGPGGALNGVISSTRPSLRHLEKFQAITVGGSASAFDASEFTSDRIR